MNSHQSLSFEHQDTQPMSNLDTQDYIPLSLESVSEVKPASVVTKDRSIIPWHNIATILRLFKKFILMPFNTTLYHIELAGIERNSGKEIRVSYIGDNTSYEYLLSTVFNDKPEIIRQEKISWWLVNRQLKNSEQVTDLLLGDFDFPLNLFVKKHKALIMPRWIKQKVVIADQWSNVLSTLRRKTRRESLRSIRKHNLTARVIRNDDSDSYFYHELYKPYIQRRYGNQATLVNEKRFLNECATGQLIQILNGEKILAVVLVHITGKRLTLAWTGIHDSVEGSQLNGVTDALDMYSLLFAYEQGCDVMDMGGTRPLVNDGVLRYKKKWGAAVSLGLIPKGSLLFRPGEINPGEINQVTQSFLQNTPTIIKKGDKISCVSWQFLHKEDMQILSSMKEEALIEFITNKFTEQFELMYQSGFDEFQGFLVFDDRACEHTQQMQIKENVYKGVFNEIPYKINYVRNKKALALLSNEC